MNTCESLDPLAGWNWDMKLVALSTCESLDSLAGWNWGVKLADLNSLIVELADPNTHPDLDNAAV